MFVKLVSYNTHNHVASTCHQFQCILRGMQNSILEHGDYHLKLYNIVCMVDLSYQFIQVQFTIYFSLVFERGQFIGQEKYHCLNISLFFQYMVAWKLPQNSSGDVKKQLFGDIVRKWPLEKYIYVCLIRITKMWQYDLPHIFQPL